MKQKPKRFWTERELQILRERYPHESTKSIARRLKRPECAVYNKAHSLGLYKTETYLASSDACRLRRGDNVGRNTRFQKGQVPHNKGLRRPGWHRGRMKETQFKKGERHGRAAQIYQPIGSERISKEGILQRKVNNDMPFQQRWKAVHAILWEKHNGPIPKGHVVVFRNGDRTDIRIENLELISRAQLMQRNSYHNNYPKEVALAIQLRAALVRQINRRHKSEKHENPNQAPA